MTMKRTNMIDHVKLNVGNRTGIDSEIDDYLDWAIEDMASIRNWRCMKEWDTTNLKTRAETMHYELPPDVKDLLRVKYVDGVMTRTLKFVDPDHYHELWPHPENDGAGYPEIYTWEGDYLEIYPLASETGNPIHVFGAFWPDPFDDDQDEWPIERTEKVGIARATQFAFEALKDMEWAYFWEQKFLKRLKRAARNDGNPSDWTPRWASVRMQRYRTTGYLSVPPE